jgi:hypothetical protein
MDQFRRVMPDSPGCPSLRSSSPTRSNTIIEMLTTAAGVHLRRGLRVKRGWRLNTARRVIAVGVLMLIVGAAPAGAASLVYLDAASNVWITSPDGAIKHQLTSDAKPDSLYLSPSMQDDGTVVVPNQDGFTRVLNPDATKKSGPWINPAPATFSTALNWADAAPAGNFYLAAQYSAPFGGGPDPTVSLAALDAPGTSNCAVYVCQFDLVRPRFIPGTGDYTAITDGRDPVSYNGEPVKVVKADGTIVDWLHFTPPGPANPDSDFRNVDVSRTGTRVLVEETPEGITTSSSLSVLESTGTPPHGMISPLCSLDRFAAGDARPRFSPDVTQISFTKPDGLHVASAPTAGPNGTCVLANDHLVIPGARDADWSLYTLPAPPPPGCQATGSCPSPSCGVAGKPGASLRRRTPVQARPARPVSAARRSLSTGTRCVIAQRCPAAARRRVGAVPRAARTRSTTTSARSSASTDKTQPTTRTLTHGPHQDPCC